MVPYATLAGDHQLLVGATTAAAAISLYQARFI